MAILNPTRIETIDYGQQYWNHIFNTNAQKVNQYFEIIAGMWNGTAQHNQTITYNFLQNKWIPSDLPVLPPPSSSVVTPVNDIVLIDRSIAKFFTLQITTNLSINFVNFNNGMVINLITTQNNVGGHELSFPESNLAGTIVTLPNTITWYQCYKIEDVIFIEVLGNFEG